MPFLKTRDNVNLYYNILGEGKEIVLLHGWKSSADAYLKAAELLSDQYRCIFYDHRGHKRSNTTAHPDLSVLADDVKEVIEKLCTGKPTLIGWSMGGLTALEYIRKYSCADISALILVDITPKMLNDSTWPCGVYSEEELFKENQLMQEDFLAFLRQYYSQRVPGYAMKPEQEQWSRVKEKSVGFDLGAIQSLWLSLTNQDYRNDLDKITVPTAVFRAGVRPCCSAEAAAFYEAHIAADVKTVLFENASHELIIEQPEEFARQVRLFLEK